jgi:hypothetical protein
MTVPSPSISGVRVGAGVSELSAGWIGGRADDLADLVAGFAGTSSPVPRPDLRLQRGRLVDGGEQVLGESISSMRSVLPANSVCGLSGSLHPLAAKRPW